MNDYGVRPINSTEGKDFIKENHYTHGCHNGPTCFGLFEKQVLIGVCAFATPCSENVRASVFGEDYKNSVTELHRLFIIDGTPKNTESWFVSRVLKLLKQTKPEILAVLSFADSTEGHTGVIYQALNAIYCGKTKKERFFRDETGRLRHKRQNGVNTSIENGAEKKWVPEIRQPKYRYLWILPNDKRQKNELYALLKLKKELYPKA